MEVAPPQTMPGKLDRYRQRRDFARTAEPRGATDAPPAGELSYVVQKHDATRLHYDLRLEHDGVLKSWAVPKEPSYDPKERRLAVQTEDHPLEYGAFEGEIAEDQYGAGSVVIWDRGHWTPLNDPDRGLKDGKLDFELHGERLRGRWTLVRMAERAARSRQKAKDNWLLIKRSDADVGSPLQRTSSPHSQRLEPSAVAGSRRAPLPTEARPQLATASKHAPDGAEWLHEPKLDGYRLLCRVDDGHATLFTRRGNDWTARFPGLASAVEALPCRAALLDGEAVVFDARGLSSFQRLQNAIARNDPAVTLVAFDLLYLDGWDLRDASLFDRKDLLRRLLEGARETLRYGDHVVGNGARFYQQACRLGLEGVVSKRADSRYRDERTQSWLKVKCQQRQEFVIVGYTDPGGSRTGFGALLLGTRHDCRDGLRYAGKVGTGFDERALRDLKARLERLEMREAPISARSVGGLGRDVHWVAPELVAEIAFAEWTRDGRLRHPTFRGLREDKVGAEVVAEHPARLDASGAPPTRPPTPPVHVKLTHPDRVLFPDPGITKLELAQYWETVAEFALPLISNRPLTLRRCPEGYEGQCFYQKHVGKGVPKDVPRVVIDEDAEPYAMVDGVAALQALTQIGVLELHAWGARVGHLDNPDVLVFDLDPDEDLSFRAVAEAAFELRARLEDLGLVPFLRLTGGKGLHLVVPVVAGPRWPAVKSFTRALVHELVRAEPSRYTASVSKGKRSGKIFIDYLRNDRESTAIASYSPRARPGAPVAMPIAWDELPRDANTPPRFLLRDVAAHLARRKRDPWHDFDAARRKLTD